MPFRRRGNDGENASSKPNNTISDKDWDRTQRGADKAFHALPLMDRYRRGEHVEQMRTKQDRN